MYRTYSPTPQPYNVRRPSTRRTTEQLPPPKKRHRLRKWVLILIIVAVGYGVVHSYGHSVPFVHAASSTIPEIKSGKHGYCLDDQHDSSGPNAVVDSWPCNGTKSQAWVISNQTIKLQGTKLCLSVQGNGITAGDSVVLNTCNLSVGQQWNRYMDGYQNVNSGLCLGMPNGRADTQLVLTSCNTSQEDTAWMTAFYRVGMAPAGPCTGTEGEKVACYAEKQYAAWTSPGANHNALLNTYSDGNGYEEWCADFVSYVYKEAGYPFTQGERNGWDQYDADSIQNMGFTLHPAANYTPKPGDVAFFNYNGGHVEIVVVGGKTPTFVYGDSGITDPQSGNGQMEENTETSDGTAGQVQYYLSPN